MNPCSINGHKTTQRLLRISIKQGQPRLRTGLTIVIVLLSFLMPKVSCRIWLPRLIEMSAISANLRIFTLRSTNTRSCILSTVSAAGHVDARQNLTSNCHQVLTCSLKKFVLNYSAFILTQQGHLACFLLIRQLSQFYTISHNTRRQ